MTSRITKTLIVASIVAPLFLVSQEKSGNKSKNPPPDFVAYEKAPEVVSKVEPDYPPLAVKSGLEGNVLVKVWIDESGRVVEATVVRTTQATFNDAATNAARQWKFKPAISDGKPVAVWVSIPFRFRLSGGVNKSPENREQFIESLQSIASNIIRGGDPEKARSSIDPEAYVIDGSQFENLWAVLNGEAKTCKVVEGPTAKISFTHIYVTDDLSAASMVVKTSSVDGKHERYTSIFFVKEPTGEWKVKSWHVSG